MDTDRPSDPQSAAVIEAGQEALTKGAWEEARSAFEHALQAVESPQALEGQSQLQLLNSIPSMDQSTVLTAYLPLSNAHF